MKRTIVALAFVLGLLPGGSQAAEEFEKVGTIGAQFLKIGVGARAQAMGGAFVSVADDASAVYWNPAGIARISRSVVNVNHSSWLADIAFTQAAYVFEVGFLPGKLALGARSLYMDSQPVRTVFRPEGTGASFDNGDLAVGLTYGRSFTDKFSAGITANFIQLSLADEKSDAYAFDFGTLYDTGYRSLRIGMSIQNIGSDVKFIDQTEKLPTVFRVGMSMNLYESDSHLLITAGEFSHPPDNAERASWGVEYGFKEFFFTRAGYQFRYDLESYSTGIGFKVATGFSSEARIDYAYTDMGVLPGTHRFSADFRF